VIWLAIPLLIMALGGLWDEWYYAKNPHIKRPHEYPGL